MTKVSRQRIILEDCGQGFLEFEVTSKGLIAKANLQGDVWNGRQLKLSTLPLEAGDSVVFFDNKALLYRVVKAERIGGTP